MPSDSHTVSLSSTSLSLKEFLHKTNPKLYDINNSTNSENLHVSSQNSIQQNFIYVFIFLFVKSLYTRCTHEDDEMKIYQMK